MNSLVFSQSDFTTFEQNYLQTFYKLMIFNIKEAFFFIMKLNILPNASNFCLLQK